MHQLAVLLLHGLLRQAATTPLDQEPPNESALDQEHQHAADRLASMLLREWRLFEVDDGGARNPGRADAPATDLSPVEVHDRQRDGGQVETLRRGSRQQHALRLPSLVPHRRKAHDRATDDAGAPRDSAPICAQPGSAAPSPSSMARLVDSRRSLGIEHERVLGMPPAGTDTSSSELAVRTRPRFSGARGQSIDIPEVSSGATPVVQTRNIPPIGRWPARNPGGGVHESRRFRRAAATAYNLP
jgi:hypothetical protein